MGLHDPFEYKFALDLISFGGLYKTLQASKVRGVLILGISSIPTWKS
jgi:hypothetical protein